MIDIDLTNFRGLVADDDPEIRGLIVQTLETTGLRVVGVEDGLSAQQAIVDCGGFDIILSDQMMPHVTGIEFCHWVRQRFDDEIVPFIIITAVEDSDAKIKALRCGADDYLLKPFHVHELIAKVKHCLNLRKLSLNLKAANKELLAAQQQLIEQERQLTASTMAGTAAHRLGQPLSAALLQLHMAEKAIGSDDRGLLNASLEAIRIELERTVEILRSLSSLSPSHKAPYSETLKIFS